MAKRSARRSRRNPPTEFSLKSLHRCFNATRTRLSMYAPTAAVKKMQQDLNNAQKMVACPQGMLRDMSKATAS